MRFEGKWSAYLEAIHVLRYFVDFLAAQGGDTAQQDETRRRLKGVGLCMGWAVSTIWNDIVWEGQSRAAPAPFGPGTGVNLCQRHIVTLDLHWDTQGHQAAPVQLLCPSDTCIVFDLAM